MNQVLSFMSWLKPKLISGELKNSIRAVGKNDYRNKLGIGDIAHIWIVNKDKSREFIFDVSITGKRHFRLTDMPRTTAEAIRTVSPNTFDTWDNLAIKQGFESYIKFINYYKSHPSKDDRFIYFEWDNPKEKLIFQIGKFIQLRLQDNQTNIYIKNKGGAYQLFNQCKYLLFVNPKKTIPNNRILNSIDEMAEAYVGKHEGNNKQFDLHIKMEKQLDKTTEFWGHCSNLQAWYEHDFDTRLLRRNLAFPLLKKLVDVGEPKAIKVFKEEIAKRIIEDKQGFLEGITTLSTQSYLITQGYLWIFDLIEFKAILQDIILEELHQNDLFKIYDILLSKTIGYKTNVLFKEPKKTISTQKQKNLEAFIYDFLNDKEFIDQEDYIMTKISYLPLSYIFIKFLSKKIKWEDRPYTEYFISKYMEALIMEYNKKTKGGISNIPLMDKLIKLIEHKSMKTIGSLKILTKFNFSFQDYKYLMERIKPKIKEFRANFTSNVELPLKLMSCLNNQTDLTTKDFKDNVDMILKGLNKNTFKLFLQDIKPNISNLTVKRLLLLKKIFKRKNIELAPKGTYYQDIDHEIQRISQQIVYKLQDNEDLIFKTKDHEVIDRYLRGIGKNTKLQRIENIILKLKELNIFIRMSIQSMRLITMIYLREITINYLKDFPGFRERFKFIKQHFSKEMAYDFINGQHHKKMSYQQLILFKKCFNFKIWRPSNYRTFNKFYELLSKRTGDNKKYIQKKITEWF